MSEVVGAFIGAEARHEEANMAAKAALGPLGGLAQARLELAEGHLDRVEIPWGMDSGPLPGGVRLLPPSLRRRSCNASCLDLTCRPLSAPILAQSLCHWN